MITTKYLIFIMDMTDSHETLFETWQVDNLSYQYFDDPQKLNQAVYANLILGNLVETKKVVGDFSNPYIAKKYVDGFLRSKGLK